jgi:hypothetical protein
MNRAVTRPGALHLAQILGPGRDDGRSPVLLGSALARGVAMVVAWPVPALQAAC